MNIETFSHITDIGAQNWCAALPAAYPFLRYEFLAALETQQCATPETGWQPMHLRVAAAFA